MKIRNVLVFPAGTEVGLELLNALEYCKEVRLFGAGQDVSNHGKFAYPEYHVLPSIYEANWLAQLVLLCETLSIDYIFPAYDDVIVALSREQKKIPAVVIAPSEETCKITRSKSDTYRILGQVIRVPKIYSVSEKLQDFPLLVKPDKGQGSFGVQKVNNPAELAVALEGVADPIVCEYLPGEEFTVDCFSDRERGVLFAKARSRRRIRNGISVNTVSEDIDEVHAIAEKINAALKLYGVWFFQLKRAQSGELVLLEVAPRIAGAMATHRVIGVNFPLLSIFEYERLPIEILVNAGRIELDRALSNRYRHSIKFGTLYVDLDDTILLRGMVNTSLVKLIFQCVNQGKWVKLITRHEGDLVGTLAKYRLAGLFDQIIHLRKDENKADFIIEPDAIFVDDSFSERRKVFEKCRIPTFDCSMVEMLINSTDPILG